ncbi:Hsp20/alpha crystallin family protein [Pantanalinema sp. GBBB05]|uniref:Hsp20/alpha crystallin family protein n=1 Tax=Pantanalinema sp. GBBB05 TaxID=2604139 RepID=UPI001D8EBEB5|nr:hypothetical protein [Pantanalinema sp. GBBB05]
MTTLSLQSIHTLNFFNQLIQDSLASLLENCQQSTLWVGNSSDLSIANVSIAANHTQMILTVVLTDGQITTLDIEISPDTVLIQGQWAKGAEIQGCFRPSHFQSLIPLPGSIDPETAQVSLEEQVLTLQFFKQDQSQSAKVRVELGLPSQPRLHPA